MSDAATGPSTGWRTSFIRVALYARAATRQQRGRRHSGRPPPDPVRTAADIVREAERRPGWCRHVAEPRPPVLMAGVMPSEALAEAEARADTARDRAGRRVKKDAAVLASWVVSCPLAWEEIRLRPEGEAFLRRWTGLAIRHLGQELGGAIRSIVLHEDEAFPHLHCLALPDLVPHDCARGGTVQILALGTVDPMRAARESFLRALPPGQKVEAAKRRADAAARQAGAALQQRHWREVGAPLGLSPPDGRAGPRVTRAQALARPPRRGGGHAQDASSDGPGAGMATAIGPGGRASLRMAVAAAARERAGPSVGAGGRPLDGEGAARTPDERRRMAEAAASRVGDGFRPRRALPDGSESVGGAALMPGEPLRPAGRGGRGGAGLGGPAPGADAAFALLARRLAAAEDALAASGARATDLAGRLAAATSALPPMARRIRQLETEQDAARASASHAAEEARREQSLAAAGAAREASRLAEDLAAARAALDEERGRAGRLAAERDAWAERAAAAGAAAAAATARAATAAAELRHRPTAAGLDAARAALARETRLRMDAERERDRARAEAGRAAATAPRADPLGPFRPWIRLGVDCALEGRQPAGPEVPGSGTREHRALREALRAGRAAVDGGTRRDAQEIVEETVARLRMSQEFWALPTSQAERDAARLALPDALRMPDAGPAHPQPQWPQAQPLKAQQQQTGRPAALPLRQGR